MGQNTPEYHSHWESYCCGMIHGDKSVGDSCAGEWSGLIGSGVGAAGQGSRDRGSGGGVSMVDGWSREGGTGWRRRVHSCGGMGIRVSGGPLRSLYCFNIMALGENRMEMSARHIYTMAPTRSGENECPTPAAAPPPPIPPFSLTSLPSPTFPSLLPPSVPDPASFPPSPSFFPPFLRY